MTIHLKMSIMFLLTSILFPCEDGYTEINGTCHANCDLEILDHFIINSPDINPILDTNNNGIIESLELCSQEWGNGRITLFDCNPIVIGNQYNGVWNYLGLPNVYCCHQQQKSE